MALNYDRKNPKLMENAVLAQLALGRIERALPVARTMEELELSSQTAHMVVVANLIAQEDYAALAARNPETHGVGPLVDGLVRGWALVGLGERDDAMAAFDRLSEENGLRAFGLYHKALALASMGELEDAAEIFAADQGVLSRISRRAAIARVEILSQLGRNEDALESLSDAFGATVDPALLELADRLEAGETLPLQQVRNPQDGLAEVFFSIALALKSEASDDYVLVYARVASFLRPDHVDAILLNAELLDNLGQYDLAVSTYKQVPQDSPEYSAAELGRAEALRRAAKPDAAIEALENLAKTYPDMPMIYSSLGDLRRQEEEYKEAVKAYDRAIELTEEGAQATWFLLYARGISHERLKEWEEAEADFRQALELNPEQPQVLNYLGYSLVERQENLEEALSMIERAVAARPDSGYIVDSLGWVLYRMGRYDEAVEHMEKAVELMAVDAVVNDHLGDVYWAVGRYREAEFQWRRALSFVDPEDENSEADPDRIRRKLEVGLDQVLAEEGAEPLKVAGE
ncbi:tetratricopeptide repeat protein [Sulfitobacter sp. BDSS02]|nr:tetratricopeptide repeat protein [Sulfitobacter sp. BDSS02]MBR9847788.1 tetratricopeptide repeat protein [Paracoccaceae bacterium]